MSQIMYKKDLTAQIVEDSADQQCYISIITQALFDETAIKHTLCSRMTDLKNYT